MIDLEAIVKSIANSIARDYQDYNVDKEDLLSEGYLIAVEQIKNYEVTKGASVSTFIYQQVSQRLRNYVSRQVLKASHGTEQMHRVSMEHVDSEMAYDEEKDTKILLDDFKLSLETEEEREVFSMMRLGFTYREISDSQGISIGTISKMVKNWGDKNATDRV